MFKSKKIRLLALDGGGVRGLSSLLILRQLMATINLENPPKPCDYFDMIGGTSTGGLIAIMLGRLQMTVDDCITAYTSMFDRIFEKKRHRVTIKGKIQGRFDADELKRAVIQILRGQGLDENSLLKGLTYFDLLPHFADCCAAEFPGSFDSIREKNLYSLARDRKWVTYRGQKILWLPPDYRPKAMEEYCTFALHGKHLAIGSSTGQVLILEFFGTNFLS